MILLAVMNLTGQSYHKAGHWDVICEWTSSAELQQALTMEETEMASFIMNSLGFTFTQFVIGSGHLNMILELIFISLFEFNYIYK